VKRERPPEDRREIRGQQAIHLGVPVGIPNELQGLGPTRRIGSRQARYDQRSQVVGAPPGQGTTRIMKGLEVEPVRDAGVEIDEHVFGHGVTMCEASGMKIGKGGHRPLDGLPANRVVDSPILQQAGQTLA
jgi:hypothetical protein